MSGKIDERKAGEKPGRRGDTRRRLMQAAEQLFGERGLHAVTLKEINAAAGQRNESALHYHFGSKQRLVQAIFADRASAIDRVRVGRVEALIGSGREHDVNAILRATFEPLTDLLDTEEGVRFVRFAAQVLNDPAFDLPIVAIRSGFEGINRANGLIIAALGDLPPDVAIQRQRMMIEVALTSLALWTRRKDAANDDAGRALFVSSLFDALAGAMRAPVSAETLAALTTGAPFDCTSAPHAPLANGSAVVTLLGLGATLPVGATFILRMQEDTGQTPAQIACPWVSIRWVPHSSCPAMWNWRTRARGIASR